MKNRQREIKYIISYCKPNDCRYFVFKTNKMKRARSFFIANKKNVVGVWKLTTTPKANITERIYRRRQPWEPKDYYLNKMGG